MTQQNPRGKITSTLTDERQRVDSLFRVSLKALIYNENGELLVVKEDEKDWDAPGGGMEHGETYGQALAREIREETGYEGDFSMELIGIEGPTYVEAVDCLQVVVGFRVVLKEAYEPNVDEGDIEAICYIDPEELKYSVDGQTCAV